MVGAGALIEANVKIGGDCRIAAYAVIRKGSVLGDGVQVDSFSVVGGDPQSIGFDPATDICQALWRHSTFFLKALVNRLGVLAAKTLDNHK